MKKNMKKKTPAELRRKHERVEKEFQKRHLSLKEIQKSDSVSLEAYHILQDILVGLRKKRTAEGLTLDEVARVSGIDKAYLSRLENGKVINPTFETLYRYASAICPIHSAKDLVSV